MRILSMGQIMVALGLMALPLPLYAAGSSSGGATRQEQGTDADNTGRNVRDRSDALPTPMDQGGSEMDRTITQQIRKAVMEREGLSMNAQNVKIITTNGVVTLRGPVKSGEEKAVIQAMVERTPGVKGVDNQIEIERNQ